MTTDHASLRPTQAARRSVFDMTPDELVELLGSWGEPTYRAGQLVEWVYQRNATSFDELTNLPGIDPAEIRWIKLELIVQTMDC